MSKYLVDDAEFPYCNGCGHIWINKALDSALIKTDLDPRQINLVSDIGCVGLLDKYFLTNTIHTTHGRSTAFASGLHLADSILFNTDSKHIVMIGDGGATIGLLHLVEAARLNLDITVILHNNFVYGMTGGQNSGFTPLEFVTASTRSGNFSQPIHIAELLAASGASYISRKLATDQDLDQEIYEAIQHKGFSLVEVIELCTGYASKWNKLSKNDIHEILAASNSSQLSNIKKETKATYAENYQKQFPRKENLDKSNETTNTIFDCEFDGSVSIILAGTAGEGIQFCSRTFMQALVAHKLSAIQKNDNPVTIGTGFSMSEIKFSSKPILYAGIDHADYFVISSEDGYKRVRDLIEPKSTVIIDETIAPALEGPQIHRLAFRSIAKRNANFMMLGYLLKLLAEEQSFKLNIQALEELISKNPEQILAAIKLGMEAN